jgi:hypothetical protein
VNTLKFNNKICFSLYGNLPVYCQGALDNLRIIKERYPRWEAFFFTKGVSVRTLNSLGDEGATVVECEFRNMTLARFLPFCGDGISLSRDCDSRISDREMRAVEEWLQSGKPRHVIRDHPEHIPGWATVPAGLWGSREPLGKELEKSLLEALDSPEYASWGGDQRWLAENIWNPDEFHVHQYDQISWMGESWSPEQFCGMKCNPDGSPM